MEPTEIATPSLWRGALAGFTAGIVASFAMDRFQAAHATLSSAKGGGEPATEKAADRLASFSTGAPIPDARKAFAGQTVHYALGGALGLAYGMAVELVPAVASGRGAAFGATTAITLDEIAVPAAGLGAAPWKTPPATHVYSAASHLLFGTVTEGTRRLVRRLLG